MPQEHERALGNWQPELAEWPGLLMSAHGCARAMAQALPGLRVDTQRMRANLDALRAALPAHVADSFSPELARHAAELTGTQARILADAMAALPDRRKKQNEEGVSMSDYDKGLA
jgi:3-carboxy-cis,cis-muconate cycloisomerase